MINMLSKALEQGQRCIFFSRELPNSELMKKIICLESEQLSYGHVRKNVFTDQSIEYLMITYNLYLVKGHIVKEDYRLKNL